MTKTQKRIAKGTLIALGVVIILIASFWAGENWRSKREWENYKRDLAAKGEVLDWNAYIPTPVTDDQNVFKAPKMTEWFVKSRGDSATNELYQKFKFATKLSLPTPLADLTPQKAAEFLALSASVEADFDLIREALKLPYARMDGANQPEFAFASPIQNFVNLRSVAQVLAQRGKCFLILGQPEKALREFTLLHNLSHLMDEKPMYLVTVMIDVAITGLYADCIADSFQLHPWRENELMVLQAQLERVNLLPRLVESFRTERAGICHDFEMGFRHAAEVGNEESELFFTGSFLPGWFYRNLKSIAQLEQQTIDSLSVASNLVPANLTESSRKISVALLHPWPYKMLAAISIPHSLKAVQTMARNQTLANETQIVCALERYHLAHDQYPDTLDALIPQFIEKIPNDMIGGQPLKYHRTNDGKFLLYAVGWNETDDGGQVILTKNGNPDFEKGDWVWQPSSQ